MFLTMLTWSAILVYILCKWSQLMLCMLFPSSVCQWWDRASWWKVSIWLSALLSCPNTMEYYLVNITHYIIANIQNSYITCTVYLIDLSLQEGDVNKIWIASVITVTIYTVMSLHLVSLFCVRWWCKLHMLFCTIKLLVSNHAAHFCLVLKKYPWLKLHV